MGIESISHRKLKLQYYASIHITTLSFTLLAFPFPFYYTYLSLATSNMNSSFHIGFFPPPGLGLVLNSWIPILRRAYGSAFPNIPGELFYRNILE